MDFISQSLPIAALNALLSFPLLPSPFLSFLFFVAPTHDGFQRNPSNEMNLIFDPVVTKRDSISSGLTRWILILFENRDKLKVEELNSLPDCNRKNRFKEADTC